MYLLGFKHHINSIHFGTTLITSSSPLCQCDDACNAARPLIHRWVISTPSLKLAPLHMTITSGDKPKRPFGVSINVILTKGKRHLSWYGWAGFHTKLFCILQAKISDTHLGNGWPARCYNGGLVTQGFILCCYRILLLKFYFFNNTVKQDTRWWCQRFDIHQVAY